MTDTDQRVTTATDTDGSPAPGPGAWAVLLPPAGTTRSGSSTTTRWS